MIKNQLQLKVSRSRLREFEQALDENGKKEAPAGTDPIMWKAFREGMQSQIDILQYEIDEYEALCSGAVSEINVETLDQLPLGLIKARVARGMTHKDLADRIGVKPQQVQRWEENDYENTGFSRLVEIANALDVQISESIALRKKKSVGISVLKELGIGKHFLRNRLAPDAGDRDDDILAAAASWLERVWGVIVDRDGTIDVSGFACASTGYARFKLPKNADPTRVRAYAQYAHFVAERVASAMESEIKSVPQDWVSVRKILADGHQLSLRTALERVWDLGIPVVPLSDKVRFHGSCWRINGRNVIVLKQSVRSESRWLFDLLHEFRHAGEEGEGDGFEPLGIDGTDPARRESDEEKAANDFAGNVLLGGNAENLYGQVLQRARRSVPLIKRAVESIANENSLDVGALANYVAYRLSAESCADWWGAAINLQPDSKDAYSTTAEVFKERFPYSNLPDDERMLVELAVSEPAL